MATFKIGEIAVFQNALFFHDLNGLECTVIGGLESRMVLNMGTFEMCYGTDLIRNGVHIFALPHQLRKRRPPEKSEAEMRILSLFIQPFILIPDEEKV